MNQAEAPEPGHKGLILLVDDEPDVRASLSLILRMEHYAVMTASHGAMALEILDSATPDLLLTDFMMPWMNGRELIVKARAIRPIPAIVMSGVTPGDPRPWDAFLRKPMEVNDLVATVERVLAARRSL